MRVTIHEYDDRDGGGHHMIETAIDGKTRISMLSGSHPEPGRSVRLAASVDAHSDDNAEGYARLIDSLDTLKAEVQKRLDATHKAKELMK